MMYARGTSLDNEEKAYNTRNGGHTGSGRKAKAICADGKVRSFAAGVADTVWTIPAHGRIRRRYVSGFLSFATASGLSTATETDPAYLTFTETRKEKG